MLFVLLLPTDLSSSPLKYAPGPIVEPLLEFLNR